VTQAAKLRQLERDLLVEFRHLPAERVAQVFETLKAKFRDARVQAYVPILLERDVRAALSATPADNDEQQPRPPMTSQEARES
jgi:hypothetical protein